MSDPKKIFVYGQNEMGIAESGAEILSAEQMRRTMLDSFPLTNLAVSADPLQRLAEKLVVLRVAGIKYPLYVAIFPPLLDPAMIDVLVKPDEVNISFFPSAADYLAHKIRYQVITLVPREFAFEKNYAQGILVDAYKYEADFKTPLGKVAAVDRQANPGNPVDGKRPIQPRGILVVVGGMIYARSLLADDTNETSEHFAGFVVA